MGETPGFAFGKEFLKPDFATNRVANFGKLAKKARTLEMQGAPISMRCLGDRRSDG